MKRATYNTSSRPPTQATVTSRWRLIASSSHLAFAIWPRHVTARLTACSLSHSLFRFLSLTLSARADMLGATTRKMAALLSSRNKNTLHRACRSFPMGWSLDGRSECTEGSQRIRRILLKSREIVIASQAVCRASARGKFESRNTLFSFYLLSLKQIYTIDSFFPCNLF